MHFLAFDSLSAGFTSSFYPTGGGGGGGGEWLWPQPEVKGTIKDDCTRT